MRLKCVIVRWVPNELWLGGWEPIEVLEGKHIPLDRDGEVWSCVEIIPGSQTRIINPSGVALYLELTPICPVPCGN